MIMMERRALLSALLVYDNCSPKVKCFFVNVPLIKQNSLYIVCFVKTSYHFNRNNVIILGIKFQYINKYIKYPPLKYVHYQFFFFENFF